MRELELEWELGTQHIPAQAKPDGRKVTAVISSSAAIVSLVAEKARAGEPLGPLDAIMPAYNASKGAVNRRALELRAASNMHQCSHDELQSLSCPAALCRTDLSRPCFSTCRKHCSSCAVTMQLANEHKKDGYTFVAIHPGAYDLPSRIGCRTTTCA